MSLDRPTFPTVRLTEGYDTEQVDLAVAMVLENLALPEPRIGRSDIEGIRFSPVRMRPGYTMSAVDDWLDEVVAELDRRHGVPPSARPEPSAPTAAPQPASYAPTAIEPVQDRPDWTLALILITITLVVTVLLYTSRF